jgi:hypothetical protein
MKRFAKWLPLVGAAGAVLGLWSLGDSAFSQTSQPAPATAPALTPAEQKLLVQLSSADWRTRNAAEQSLVDRTDISAAILRAMLDQTGSPEARIRLLTALPKVQGRELISATPITLHVANAPAGWAVRQIFRQAHWPAQELPTAFLLRIAHQRVTIEADGQPFWSVLGGVCRQLHVWLYLNPDVPITDSPFSVHGAIFAQVIQLSYHKGIALSDNVGERAGRSFGMQLWGFSEPRAPIAETSQNLKVLEAIDDHGNSLVAPAQPDVRIPFSRGWLMDVVLNYPIHNPGSRLVHFRAIETITLRMKSQQIVIPDLLAAQPQVWQIGDQQVCFDGCTWKEGRFEGSIRTEDLGTDAEKRLMRDAEYNMLLRDASGKALMTAGYTRRDDGKDLVLTFTYFPPVPAPNAKPPRIALVWNPSAVTVDEDIPVTFNDLNIRIPGATDNPETRP